MNRFLFLFLLAFLAAQVGQAQDTTTVSFSLDTLRSDSFFLQITNTLKPQGEKRNRTFTEEVFFSDTLAFNGYIDALKQRLSDLSAQKAQIGLEYDAVNQQVTDIEGLRDSVFRGLSPAPKSALAPPPGAEAAFSRSVEQEAGSTVWVVYGATPEQVVKMESGLSLEESAVILKPNGTIVQFKKPKKRKRE